MSRSWNWSDIERAGHAEKSQPQTRAQGNSLASTVATLSERLVALEALFAEERTRTEALSLKMQGEIDRLKRLAAGTTRSSGRPAKAGSVSEADREAAVQAIEEGRVTKLKPGYAMGSGHNSWEDIRR
ncbi:MAG: hypothetical protein H6884_09615 [Rhodobiaceae bacterium]|nr:hypothetical protein [Rhodobiaceae bacterium]